MNGPISNFPGGVIAPGARNCAISFVLAIAEPHSDCASAGRSGHIAYRGWMAAAVRVRGLAKRTHFSQCFQPEIARAPSGKATATRSACCYATTSTASAVAMTTTPSRPITVASTVSPERTRLCGCSHLRRSLDDIAGSAWAWGSHRVPAADVGPAEADRQHRGEIGTLHHRVVDYFLGAGEGAFGQAIEIEIGGEVVDGAPWPLS
jgi:hypothetical protein